MKKIENQSILSRGLVTRFIPGVLKVLAQLLSFNNLRSLKATNLQKSAIKVSLLKILTLFLQFSTAMTLCSSQFSTFVKTFISCSSVPERTAFPILALRSPKEWGSDVYATILQQPTTRKSLMRQIRWPSRATFSTNPLVCHPGTVATKNKNKNVLRTHKTE